MLNTSQYCRVKQSIRNVIEPAPTLNEFLAKRPKLSRIDIVGVVLLYQEYLIDHYQEIAADQPSLDIWEL